MDQSRINPKTCGETKITHKYFAKLVSGKRKSTDTLFKNTKENIVGVARALGYLIIDTKENGQYNLVRKLTGQNYPRFHAYVKQQGTDFIFSLHLDQKKPSYEGSHAHSGEYEGDIVEREAQRIKNILENSR